MLRILSNIWDLVEVHVDNKFNKSYKNILLCNITSTDCMEFTKGINSQLTHVYFLPLPQTSPSSAILGLRGLYGPCFFTCSMAVSSLNIACSYK